MAGYERKSDIIRDIRNLQESVRRLWTRIQPGGVDAITYSLSGTLTVVDGGLRWYPLTNGVVTNVHAAVGTPPSGGNAQIRVSKNTLPFAVVTISSGTNTGSIAPDPGEYVVGDFFTVDIAAGFNAEDLVVQLQLSD